MNKVWIIEVEKSLFGEHQTQILKVRNTPGKAQLVKKHLLADIARVKAEYKKMYDSSYDEDWERISDGTLLMTNEELYDEIVERFYTYQMRFDVLKITDIIITEYDVE